MQERKNGNQLQWFDQYRPSKTVLFWACAGSAILAIVVGFSSGGWVTGGTAEAMVDRATAQARQELAAVVCVDRFMAAGDARVQLAALQKITSPYAQSQFVQDGGWAIMPVSSNPESTMSASITDDRKAAGLCAEELARREVPSAGGVTHINDEAVVAQ